MPDDKINNPGGAPAPSPDKSPNPSPAPNQAPPSAPPSTPPPSKPSVPSPASPSLEPPGPASPAPHPPAPSSPPSPPQTSAPKSDPLPSQTSNAPSMLKVDIGKDSLRKFEIHTMADDLGRPSKAPQGLGSSSVSPPSPPKMAPAAPPKPLSSTSPKPPSPPLPPETPEMLFEEESKRGGMLKSFLLGFVVILLLGGIGLGTWWYLGVESTETPPIMPTVVMPPPDDNPPPVTVDTPLLPVDKSFTVELSQGATRRELFQKLSSHVNSTRELSSRDIARVVLTKNNTLITLADFEELLGVDFSPYVDQKVFTLVYSPREAGATYGLILKTTDAERLAEFFALQERNIPSLANDIYTNYTNRALPQASTNEFLENIHQGVVIRYLNFDSPERAFDYAIHEDLLLMAGSKDLMFSLVDKANFRSLLGGNE